MTANIDQSVVTITEASFDVVAQMMYRTSDFNYKLKADWHCTTDCTNKGSDCYDIGPFGHWSDNIPRFNTKSHNNPAYSVDYCVIGTTGRIFMNGHWKWTTQFEILRRNMVTVSMITDKL
jgi:hypothetical protein